MSDIVHVEIPVDASTAEVLSDPLRRELAGKLVVRLCPSPNGKDRLTGWLDGMERLEKIRSTKIEGFDTDDLAALAVLLRPVQQKRGGDEILRSATVGDVVAAAAIYWGGEPQAQFWLFSPVMALGHQRPIDLLGRKDGVKEVVHFLGRLVYGVYM